MFKGNVLSLAVMLLFVTFIARVPVSAQNFTVQILHNNDGESKLFPTANGYGGAAQFLGTLNALRFDAFNNRIPSILLSSGDNFLASTSLEASLQLPVTEAPYDSRVLSAFVYDAICLGNHDFDFGPDFLARFINGFNPARKAPIFLSANLDFSGEATLQALVESGKIAKSTKVFRGNEVIGIVGLTTPTLPFVSSPRNVAVSNMLANAAQMEVDKLTAQGVNKIIVISHLQDVGEDVALSAQLKNVDIVIAGGGDDVLANNASQVVPGDIIEGPYPIVTQDANGQNVYVVTTGGDYKYVGNLTVTFDAEGRIVTVDEKSGPVPVIGKVNPAVTELLQPVTNFVNGLNADIIGRTEVDLDGRRNSIRGVETNLGNLIADGFLWQANRLSSTFGTPTPDVALSNGGGIRNNSIIAAGSNISTGTTFSISPFGNFVSVLAPLTPERFKLVMENAVAFITPNGPAGDGTGRFAQIAGFKLEYDLAGTPVDFDANGQVTVPGTRVVNITLNDGTKIVENGSIVPGARTVNMVLPDFLARGGDEYPLRDLTFTTLGLTDQQALAGFIENGLNGLVSAAQYPVGGEGRIKQVTRAPRTTVVDIVVNSDVHNTLEAAVIAAGLADDLSGEGPFTVFAPTDAAFAALPAGTVEALLADIPALTNILLYHVLGAEVLSTDLSNGLTATTLQGSDVTVTINADGVFINNAKVTIADIQADNGVVHVIDAVLLPPAPQPTTVVDIVVNSDVHNTLEAAVIAAGLADDLSGEGPFTVFAPTDAAFAALPAGTVEALLADIPALTNILLYHVLGAEVLSTDLSNGLTTTTLQGSDVTVTINADGVFINNAKVTIADIQADNGVVHVIDAVLLPPAPQPTTVVDIVVNSDVHNTLEAAVIAAGLADDLSGEGPFTVFAPTDAAFAALPAGTVEALLADIPALTNILLYHVLGAEVLSTDLSNGLTATTLQGSDVTVTINADGVFINNAKVTIADIQADNGVVHVIDAVLLPPAAPQPATVVEIIVNSDVHNTLEAAVIAAGLADDLSGEGPFTVFAPTDAAFAALPAGTVEALLADIPALTNILLYHVLAGEFLSEAVLSIGNLTFPVLTLQGTTVNVTVNDGKITVNNANVTVTDLIAENGVVHVIDAVLLPTAAAASAPTAITAKVAPNPTSELINLSYVVEAANRINIALIGKDGKLVRNVFTGEQEAGAYNLEFTVADLAAGVYFLSIQTGDQLQVLAVSIQ